MRRTYRACNVELIDEDYGIKYICDIEYSATLEHDKKVSLDVNKVWVVEAQHRVYPVKKGSLVTGEPKWFDILMEINKKLYNEYVACIYERELHDLCLEHWQEARYAKNDE
jgi:hypothetical protein